MSEYQYYEFQAIDRPLDRAAQQALRSISSRARISATRFTNHYEWGDFGGDPRKLMERWFDLHLYLANWGTRRLMIRLPKGFVKKADIDPFLSETDWVVVGTSGDNFIIDIQHHEEGGYDDWEDGTGRLAELAPLRADLLSGDLRLFYLLWLKAVQEEYVPDEEVEPLPGVGPLTGALEGFADFFAINADLVAAAAELVSDVTSTSEDGLRKALAAVPEREKAELLLRVADGDTRVAAELKRRARNNSLPAAHRTAGTLRARAKEIAEARERAATARLEAKRRSEVAKAKKARSARLEILKKRNAGSGGGRSSRRSSAATRLAMIAPCVCFRMSKHWLSMEGNQDDFDRRLGAIRTRHEREAKFIERLNKLGRGHDETLI